MVNLAVIGAGIGGCSAAYFAHKYIPDSKVTVYEMENRVGGRAFTYSKEEMNTELGAEFFNPTNKTVCNLVDELGLKVKKLKETTDIAVWNGTEIIFKSSQPMFYNLLKLFTKYKLSVPRLLRMLREANGQIKKLYTKEKPAEFWEHFENVGLDKWHKLRFDNILVNMGIDHKFIDEIITPITRIIYSQNAELGGFAGLSALLGVYGEAIYRLKDGNDSLPRKLLEASPSKLELESKVKSIEKTSKGSFRILVGENASVFDAVIIATPLEVADIAIDGVPKQLQAREYQKIYIRLMKGTVNLRYFNLNASDKLPSIILTSKQADPLTRFSFNKSPKSDETWVSVTSTEPIGNDLLDELFENGRTIVDHTWNAAYPIFKPTPKLPSTCLDKGLLYLNSIESAASSLESSTFAALNSIKIIKEQLDT
ncbi:MAG: FAD-dependent oxidoreductase [Candidatus Bathyarchaeota archaeon]|nr:FAD-dependent oxidoreductase [Candidatus Bathyarchaeum sp.]